MFTVIQLATLAFVFFVNLYSNLSLLTVRVSRLTTILSALRLNDQGMTNVYRIVESLVSLATFLVFGMSNGLLEVWRLKRPTSVQSDFHEVERRWDQNMNLNLNTEALNDLPDIEAIVGGNSQNSS
ncbi:hypothetical protein M422DRAFT_270404 [Sphaerobolus stellatus SS14]|uniref:Uncharacterized protein n=1 Tax=Sphaerobolus stellatus (strain SS14) TaxID=990650 RepID=A0A0C9USZ2_SPHS4|nr:hypothetical protein M422DRAFT_270404 [Sphaerobolus stellatus SS14]